MRASRHMCPILSSPVPCAERVLDGFLNLFFPEVCFICATPIAHRKDRGVCAGCRGRALALKIHPPFCPSCGLPMPNFQTDSVSLCGTCILNPPAFAGARSFGYYDGELARLIQGLKFHNRRNLVNILGPLLVEAYNATWTPSAFDLLVAVPLHPERRCTRGYNQSGLLARFLSRRVGIPFGRHALIRRRSTLPQVGLSDSQRRNNVRNAFRCTVKPGTAGCRILLIDDVLTTGATASSAAQALIKGGALRVSVLTVARTE